MTLTQATLSVIGGTAAAGTAAVAVESQWTTPAMIGIYGGIIAVVTLIVNTVAGIISNRDKSQEAERKRRADEDREARQHLWEIEDRKWKLHLAEQTRVAAVTAAQVTEDAKALKAEVASSREERAAQLTSLLNAVDENTKLTQEIKQTVEPK